MPPVLVRRDGDLPHWLKHHCPPAEPDFTPDRVDPTSCYGVT